LTSSDTLSISEAAPLPRPPQPINAIFSGPPAPAWALRATLSAAAPAAATAEQGQRALCGVWAKQDDLRARV
jgi:hypothetical protein